MSAGAGQQRRNHGGILLPLIVAHRGASRDAVENTVPAFESAWEQGADAIETDVHLTADGEIVCIHDDNVSMNDGRRLAIAEAALDELRKMDPCGKRDAHFPLIRIPTLAEALATVPAGKRIFVEVKCGPEILDALYRVIENSGLGKDQVVVISFDQSVIKAVKQQAPQFKALLLCAFETDPATGMVSPAIDELLHVLRAIKADGLSTQDHPAVTSHFVRRLRADGYEWHVWTVDDPKTAGAYMALGVDAITTNRPGYLRETLSTRAGRLE